MLKDPDNKTEVSQPSTEERITLLEKRLQVAEQALMRQIENFENHSHSGLGLAVVPARRA